MAVAEFILANTVLRALKVRQFKVPEIQSDEAIKTSLLGTPVFSNLEIPAGNYKDLDGNVIEFDGITIDTVLMVANRQKRIIETDINGKPDGSVKEFSNNTDYTISVEGVLIGAQQNVFPEEAMTALIAICDVPESIRVVSEFLNFFNIDEVVITNQQFSQKRGSRNQQPFTLSMLSDTPLILQ